MRKDVAPDSMGPVVYHFKTALARLDLNNLTVLRDDTWLVVPCRNCELHHPLFITVTQLVQTTATDDFLQQHPARLCNRSAIPEIPLITS